MIIDFSKIDGHKKRKFVFYNLRPITRVIYLPEIRGSVHTLTRVSICFIVDVNLRTKYYNNTIVL